MGDEKINNKKFIPINDFMGWGARYYPDKNIVRFADGGTMSKKQFDEHEAGLRAHQKEMEQNGKFIINENVKERLKKGETLTIWQRNK